MSTRKPPKPTNSSSRFTQAAVARAMPPRETIPTPATEPEIHRELGNLTNAGRNLSAVVEELYARLQPILLEHPGETADEAARIRCETSIGHQIRDEETGINANVGRLRDLIVRLGV